MCAAQQCYFFFFPFLQKHFQAHLRYGCFDAFVVYKKATGRNKTYLQFHHNLVEALIDKNSQPQPNNKGCKSSAADNGLVALSLPQVHSANG